MNNSTIDASIYDDGEGMGAVEFYLFETEPTPCAPGPERPAFTTADAAIALSSEMLRFASHSRSQSAATRPTRTGSVTALGALMILQAAAGKVDLS